MQRDHLEHQLRSELGWLTSQRWFGDKARPVTDLRVVLTDGVAVGDARLLLNLVEFTHEWGEPSTYFVPLLEGDAPLAERDAVRDSSILKWFAQGFLEERRIESNGAWEWRRIGDQFPELDSLDDSAIRPISGEQSNSSVLFGEEAIAKIFRKVQSGVNPDLEIGEHFMAQSDFQQVPDLFGVVSLELDGQRMDIAALQAFVPNVGDGWSWLLSRLETTSTRHELIEEVALLGQRTAEMHLVLAQEGGHEAFAPVTVGEDEAQAIIRRVIGEMEGSVEGLTHHLQPDEIERLHKGLGAMMGDAWSLVGTNLIRVHGDYHLGQTLRTADGDFAIIDFEGEPNRPMEERREKLPALKDVAGMIRSLDYAGASLGQHAESDKERAEIAAWVKAAADAFVASYRQAIDGAAVQIVPQNDEAFTSVLNLMVAEKALYELRYEMNNRPDWLWIPLDALLRLVNVEEVQ